MSIKDKIYSSSQRLFTTITATNISFLLLIIFVIGIFTTETHRVLSTVGIVGLFIISLLGINKESFQKAKLHKPILLLCLIFFMHLLDGIHTDFLTNTEYFKGRLMLKVPFLILPLSVLFLPKLSTKRYNFLLLVFVLCSTFIALNACLYYVLHTDEVLDLYIRSKTIPLPLNHVRFSLMLSMAIFISGYLYYKKIWFLHVIESKIILGISIFLFFFLHLLSVRSGLLAFYTLALLLGVAYAIKTKKLKLVIIGVLIMAILPIVSYICVPTFKNKVKNTREDINNTKYEYYANFHSLTARVFSYKVAGKIIQERPLLGVGIGNLEREVHKTYIENYSEINPSSRLKPHNQFLSYLTAFGFIGITFFIIGFYGILYFKRYRSNIILIVHFLIISVSFLFESTLDTQLGANFSLCFIILPLYYMIGNDKSDAHAIQKTAK